MNQDNLTKILTDHKKDYAAVVPKEFLAEAPFIFDFKKNNSEIAKIDITDIQAFSAYIELSLEKAGKKMGAGGYGEDRVLYFSSLFAKGEEPRTIHLGIDLWLPAGTEIYSSLPGKIHSFQDNNHLLDYGPTIILEHELDGTIFYTLYGHLRRASLKNLFLGKKIAAGEQIATLGNSKENGQWPPHLHFQIISDMLGKRGDFPGVAKPSEKDYYLNLCPDPNLILQMQALGSPMGNPS